MVVNICTIYGSLASPQSVTFSDASCVVFLSTVLLLLIQHWFNLSVVHLTKSLIRHNSTISAFVYQGVLFVLVLSYVFFLLNTSANKVFCCEVTSSVLLPLVFVVPPSSVAWVCVLPFLPSEEMVLVPPELGIIFLTPLKNLSIIAFLLIYVIPIALNISISLHISYFLFCLHILHNK